MRFGWPDGQTVHCGADVLVGVHLVVLVGGKEVLGLVQSVLRTVDVLVATVTGTTWRGWR